MFSTLLHRIPLLEPKVDRPYKSRIFALDGLRGWASLSVVCFHLLWETFGEVNPQIRNAFTAFLLDGSLAVSLFFVLSGEALSSSYFSGGGRRAVMDLAIKRYPRLVIPVLVTSVITAALIYLGISHNTAAGNIVMRPDWLGSFVGFAPSILGTLRFALFDVFTAVAPAESLVPFLWTMRIELMGSVLVFALLLVGHRRWYGWPTIMAVFVGLMAAYFIRRSLSAGNLACFIAGLVFAKLRFAGFFARIKARPKTFYVSFGAIVVLLAVDSLKHGNNFSDAWSPLLAMLLVVFISCNNLVEKSLSSPVSQFLGRISFPLFLIQFPIIITLTSWLIVWAGPRVSNINIILIIFMCSLITCVIAAIVFEPVEHLTKKFCKYLSRKVFAMFSQRLAGHIR